MNVYEYVCKKCKTKSMSNLKLEGKALRCRKCRGGLKELVKTVPEKSKEKPVRKTEEKKPSND